VRNTAILTGTGTIIGASIPGSSITPIFSPGQTLLLYGAVAGAHMAYNYMKTPTNDKKVENKIVIDKKTEDKNKNQ